MDPLSFTASVVAIIGLIGQVSGSVNVLFGALRTAPDDLIALSNEMSDLRAVLCAMKETKLTPGSETYISQSTIAVHLSQKLMELSTLIRCKVLVRSQKEDEQVTLSRLKWVKHQRDINKLCKQIRRMRINLIALLTASVAQQTASLQEHMFDYNTGLLVRLNEVDDRVEGLQYQIRHASVVDEDAEDFEELGLSPSSTLIEGSPASIESTLIKPGQPAIQTEFFRDVLRVQLNACATDCECRCHQRHSLSTPRVLQNVVGRLLVGYSGALLQNISCSEAGCRPNSAISITKVIYFFPQWFAARAVLAEFGSPSPSIRLMRVVPKNSPLFQCAARGDVDGMKMLFSTGCASPFDVAEDGYTALSRSVRLEAERDLKPEHVECVRFLLQQGADPEIQQGNNFTVTDIAMQMAYRDQPVWFEVFNIRDKVQDKEFTRLHQAVLDLIPSSLATELAISASELDAQDITGNTALSWAARRNNPDAVRSLLGYSADPNLPNKHGNTPLMVAAMISTPEVIVQLIEAGANVLQTNIDNMSALWYANDTCHPENVECLMKYEARFEQKSEVFLKLADKYGYNLTETTPLLPDLPSSVKPGFVVETVGLEHLNISGDVVELTDIEDAFEDAVEYVC